MAKPPPIDSRTAKDIAKQVQNLLLEYASDWKEFEEDTATGDRPLKGMSGALIHIFARYAEIIIQRLNQVPYKNFLAFLDLLGVSQLPPQPARVPLLFTLATGSEIDAIVPAGTQVAALPVEGEDEPVIFETERNLLVTAAQLKAIFVRDPNKDFYSNYSNYSNITTYDSDNTEEKRLRDLPVFEGEVKIEHRFDIISNTLLKPSDLQTLTLTFSLKEDLQNPESRSLKWEICDGLQCFPIFGINDQTSGLTRSGTVVFTNLGEIIRNIVSSNNLETRRSLRCQLQTPIFQSSKLPFINSVSLQATLGNTGQPIEEAFFNLLPLDLSKPFFPFGEQPKFGDTLYLANQEAFSKSGATVTLHIDLADLASAGIPLPITNKDPNATLEWEVWTARGWISVGTSTPTGPVEPLSPPQVKFRDTTQAFTVPGFDRVVEFILPENFEPTTVNGIENFWLRVRIKSGNYGEDARYQKDENTFGGFSFVPASFKPPLINSLKVDYALTTPQQPTDAIETYNDFSFQSISSSLGFEPFKPITDVVPTLYLGFRLPENRSRFPNLTLSIYFQVADVVYNPDIKTNNSSSSSLSQRSPRLTWEYWSNKSNNWERLNLEDDTEAFTHSGLVELLPPEDFIAKQDFNLQEKLYWLRVYKEPSSGEYFVKPQLKRVLLNTMIAIQSLTVSDEILGSSNGTENQNFRTTQSPVLKGEHLEVKEPEIPSFEEQEIIKNIYGEDVVSIMSDESGRPEEIWVRWSEVPDFYGSRRRDRHYIIDRNSGEIGFGDGLKGLIPPLGIANVRMRRYQAGGGTKGNRPENTIVQLQTTVPYIDAVTNPEAATGGADAQTLDTLVELGPRTVRHGGRAVTFEDYEDLAMQATPEVARAKAVPLLNLSAKPLDIQTFNPLVGENLSSFQPPKAPGEVSIIIVPRTSNPKPLPSQELMERVQNYLESHAIGTAKIWVVGPVYVEVSISTTIVPTSLEGASRVQQSVNTALINFLHPLTGGFDRLGWQFGRRPHKSDLYALLEAVPGVNYVHSLSVEPIDNPLEKIPEEIKKILDTERFLVYSGKHKIKLSSNLL
ncbi:MAG: putative baseplate assembly protein [Cyanomargarita calcarea GSE-NOS-MK-12-04C]|jgi:hypothetical protein|uniref:Baseplate assembly protein n=1 Tax=Cyanomargarita calcarea GSE-NOS-MK-12-04C TaxID=2839659 RepID=A0A951QLM9_9CYAN|nr:putative baseplate assembly protein [Cyanomargarita calcarea GSE-NOS-MK-12-04C]